MKKSYLYIAGVLLFAACDQNNAIDDIEAVQPLVLSTSVDPFVGEEETRANLTGTAFENNDWIRLKLICPFTNSTQIGESYDNSYNGFWLMKYTSGSNYLTNMKESDGCDINGDFKPSNASDISGQILSQQTPYVFVAQTWNEEKPFYNSGTRYLHYSYSFQADQSHAGGSAYKKNDLLWAQQFMQTGSQYVHLSFQHKMAALKISIDDRELTDAGKTAISSTAVLTLEGMPDIDQMEVVVGDYYADQDVYGSRAYGYKEQASCSKENNGKVLGVVVLDHAAGRAKTYALSGTTTAAGGDKNSQVWGTIPNTGTYKAYHDTENGVYRMIVPPCTLVNDPVFYLRDGERRFKLVLDQKVFEQGKMYSLKMKIKNTDVQP